jgi:TRAP-type C4-dicarboxylate transport system substrate-binding protein
MSEKVWNSLSPEDQEIIMGGVKKGQDAVYQYLNDNDSKQLQEMSDRGLIVTEPTNLDEWEQILRASYSVNVPGRVSQEEIDAVVKAIEESGL